MVRNRAGGLPGRSVAAATVSLGNSETHPDASGRACLRVLGSTGAGLQAFMRRPSTRPEQFRFACDTRHRGGGNALIEPIRIARSARRLRAFSNWEKVSLPIYWHGIFRVHRSANIANFIRGAFYGATKRILGDEKVCSIIIKLQLRSLAGLAREVQNSDMNMLPEPHLSVGDYAIYRKAGEAVGQVVRIARITGGSAGKFCHFDTEPRIEPHGVWGAHLSRADGSAFPIQFASFTEMLSRDPAIVNRASSVVRPRPRLIGVSIGEIHAPVCSATWTATIDDNVIAEVNEQIHFVALEKLAEAIRSHYAVLEADFGRKFCEGHCATREMRSLQCR
jgi:hypothetical protein